MAGNRTTIRAIYKDGVLRPLEPLDLPDDSRVNVIVESGEAKEGLADIFKDSHAANQDVPLEQIERDVAQVIKEVREEDPIESGGS